MLNCTGPPRTTSASDRALVTAANTPSRSPGPRASKRTTVLPSRLRKKKRTTALLFPRGRGADRWAPRCDTLQARLVAEHRPQRAGRALDETIAPHSYGLRGEVSDSHQVVRGKGKGEHPVHAAAPSAAARSGSCTAPATAGHA